MRDQVFTDAARFKQLSCMILDAGNAIFPCRTKIDTIVENEIELRAWIRNYEAKNTFMSAAKLFYYRERNRRARYAARLS